MNYWNFIKSFLVISRNAPNIYKIVIVLVVAGFFDIAGFTLLIPVADFLIFDRTDFGGNWLVGIIKHFFSFELNFYHIFGLAFFFIIGGFLLQAKGHLTSYNSRFDLIKRLRMAIITGHSSLSWKAATEKHSGNINDLLIQQTEQNGAGHYTIYSFWISSLQMLTFLILGMIISYELIALVISLFIIAAAISVYLQKITRQYSRVYTQGYQDFGLMVADYNNNLKTYRSSFYLDKIVKTIISHAGIIASGLKSIYKLHIIQSFIMQVFTLIVVFVVIYVHEHFGLVDSMVLVFLAALKKLGGHMQDMFNNALAFQNYSASIYLMENEQKYIQDHQEENGECEIDSINSLVFDNVSFGYDEDNMIIDNASFSIDPNQTTVVIGKSGSGKSTLLDLILLLYHPSKGNIKINGIDGIGLDRKKYRRNIAYINQEATLNYGSIKSNITLDNVYSHEELMDACKKVRIMEWITSLEKGLDTLVGEKGVNVSGGQIQRILLARVLLLKPSLLILDEATSALDSDTELFIHKTLEDLSHRMTIILVTHKISTTSHADKYLLVGNGNVNEISSYEELVALGDV